MSLLRLLICCCLSLFAASAWALELYQGEALVQSQDENSRAKGVAEALQQVVVKVSGNPAAARHPVVTTALPEAARLMQRYEYRQELVRGADGKPQVNLYLIASFYSASVDQLLQRAGLAVWGAERPRLLVLISEQQQLLSPGKAAELMQRADARGLELRFPPATALSVEESDALGRGQTDMLAARFGGGHVLAGELNGGAGRFVINDGQANRSFSVSAADRAAALAQIADQALEVLAQQQTGAGSEPETVDVWIEGVASAADYARVLSYLDKLTPVKALTVNSVKQQQLELKLTVLGGALRLEQTVSLGDQLSLISVNPMVLQLQQ